MYSFLYSLIQKWIQSTKTSKNRSSGSFRRTTSVPAKTVIFIVTSRHPNRLWYDHIHIGIKVNSSGIDEKVKKISSTTNFLHFAVRCFFFTFPSRNTFIILHELYSWGFEFISLMIAIMYFLFLGMPSRRCHPDDGNTGTVLLSVLNSN